MPTGRRQPVGYLQVWSRIWTRDDQEQIQQVARARLELRAVGLRVRRLSLGHDASCYKNA